MQPPVMTCWKAPCPSHEYRVCLQIHTVSGGKSSLALGLLVAFPGCTEGYPPPWVPHLSLQTNVLLMGGRASEWVSSESDLADMLLMKSQLSGVANLGWGKNQLFPMAIFWCGCQHLPVAQGKGQEISPPAHIGSWMVLNGDISGTRATHAWRRDVRTQT